MTFLTRYLAERLDEMRDDDDVEPMDYGFSLWLAQYAEPEAVEAARKRESDETLH